MGTAPLTQEQIKAIRDLFAAHMLAHFVNYVTRAKDSPKFEEARAFFCSSWGDDIMDALGLDPCDIRDRVVARRDDVERLLEAGCFEDFNRWRRNFFAFHGGRFNALWRLRWGNCEGREQGLQNAELH